MKPAFLVYSFAAVFILLGEFTFDAQAELKADSDMEICIKGCTTEEGSNYIDTLVDSELGHEQCSGLCRCFFSNPDAECSAWARRRMWVNILQAGRNAYSARRDNPAIAAPRPQPSEGQSSQTQSSQTASPKQAEIPKFKCQIVNGVTDCGVGSAAYVSKSNNPLAAFERKPIPVVKPSKRRDIGSADACAFFVMGRSLGKAEVDNLFIVNRCTQAVDVYWCPDGCNGSHMEQVRLENGAHYTSEKHQPYFNRTCPSFEGDLPTYFDWEKGVCYIKEPL